MYFLSFHCHCEAPELSSLWAAGSGNRWELTWAEGNGSEVPVVLLTVSLRKSCNFSVPSFLGFISASVLVHEKTPVYWNRQCTVIKLKYCFMDVVSYHASLHPFVFPWISSDFITKISQAVAGDSWLIADSNRSSKSLKRIQIALWIHFCHWQKLAIVCTNYSNSPKAFEDRAHRGMYKEGTLPSRSLLDFQIIFPKVSSPDKIIWPMWVVSHL